MSQVGPPDRRVLPSGDVTFVFTDIESSTLLFQQMGDLYPALLLRHRDIVRAAVAAANGAEIKTEGDSFFIVFDEPVAALRCCVEVQRAISAIPWGTTPPLRVRIGIHTGQATPVAGDYYSLAVHQAARVSAAANGGQIVVSASTRSAGAGVEATGATLTSLGMHALKDFDGVQELFELRYPGLNGVFPPLRTLNRFANNLPAERTTLIGRTGDLDKVIERLRSDRLVTLIGPGGVGKTRMALEAAGAVLPHHLDGVWLAELAPFTEGRDVLSAVSTAFGAPPTAHASRAALAGWLQDGSRLLVLDNCEHLMAEAAEMVDGLLDEVPTLTVLATSREPLRLAGERIVRITPLALPESTSVAAVSTSGSGRLFLAAAGRADAGITLDAETAPIVSRILELLDGIPLAIELAAAQLINRTLTQLAAALENDLTGLTGGLRTAPDRHRGVEAVIAWSFDSLPADEQVCLTAVATCAGGFNAEVAARLMCGKVSTASATAQLNALANRSLLHLTDDGRYRALHIVREFCTRRTTPRRLAALRRRHAAYFLELASTGEASSTQRADSWRLFEAEFRTAINRAIEASDGVTAATLLTRLAFAMYAANYKPEFLSTARDVLEMPSVTDPALRGKLLFRASTTAADLGLIDEARELALESLELARSIEDPYLVGGAFWALCSVETEAGDYAAARGWAMAINGPETIGDKWRELDHANAMVDVAMAAGDVEETIARIDDLLPVVRAMDDPWSLARVLAVRGKMLEERDGPPAARESFDEAAAIAVGRPWLSLKFTLRLSDARWRCHLGDAAGAVAALRDAMWLDTADRDFEMAIETASSAAAVAAILGDAPAAQRFNELLVVAIPRGLSAVPLQVIREVQDWLATIDEPS